MSVPYLTDAERPYRPAPLRQQFRFAVDLEIRGHVYRRWFQSDADRRAYVILAGNTATVRGYAREEKPVD